MSETRQPPRTALVVTDRDLRRTAKGNTRRILSLLSRLTALGCRVLLAAPAGTVRPPVPVHEVFDVDAPVFGGGDVTGYDASAFSRAVADVCAGRHVDVAIAEYAWLAPCLAYTPADCLRVVDTHDVLHARYDSFTRHGLDPWVACSADAEAGLLAGADVVLSIQDDDAATLRRLVGRGTRVVTLPHTVTTGRVEYRPSTGAGLMFVGSWHDGNLGIRDFLARGWPLIRAARPDAELRVFGSIGQRLDPAPRCRLLGVVDDRSLARAYAEAAVVLSPVTAGSGLKIKVVEALHHGRAVVATPPSVRGMPRPRTAPWLLAEDWAGFAHAAIDLLADDRRRRGLERAGIRYARDEFGEDRVDRVLSGLLASGYAGRRISPTGRH